MSEVKERLLAKEIRIESQRRMEERVKGEVYNWSQFLREAKAKGFLNHGGYRPPSIWRRLIGTNQ